MFIARNFFFKKFTPYWAGFFLVLFIYLISYGWLLWFSDYIPYVIDNNESFSALWHAYNLYHGDLSKSFGLTDETFHPFPDAHPMIHSHQGDWPRIFAYLLYSLGAKSIESQIIITTFTIGLLVIWFMYDYFARISTLLFSVLACIIMMSDYVLFAEWQVNTYRVWHAFLVFSSLLCVHGLATSPRKKMWLGLTILNYACLFYWELVFATFVSIWAGLYAIFLYFRQLKKVALYVVCQFSGLMIGLGVLITQLVAFMGWADLIKDLNLTFIARNLTSDPKALRNILSEFYNDRNILFFYNMQDGSCYKNITTFVKSFFQYGFQIYSSLFSVVVFILCFFWLFNLGTSLSKDKQYKAIGLFGVIFALTLLVVSLNHSVNFIASFLISFTLLISILLWIQYSTYIDQKRVLWLLISPLFVFLAIFSRYYFPVPKWLDIILFFPLFLVISYLLSWFVVMTSKLSMMPQKGSTIFVLNRVLCCTLFIMSISSLVYIQDFLYDPSLRELWLNALSLPYSFFTWGFITIALICSVSILILSQKEKDLFGDSDKGKLLGVGYYLLCGFMAYTIIYWLSPGYLFSGYLTRYAPFHVFIINVLVSVALYTLLMLTKNFVRTAYIYWPVEASFIFRRLAK